MKMHFVAGMAVALGILLFSAGPLFAQDVGQLQRDFRQPPEASKIRMRWWWFGPAVTRPEIEREMRLMKQGGIGGFEVQPTYPLSLDNGPAGIKNLKFLSPEFLDAVAFTAGKAKDLGLRMDLTLGSGWPYGGPQFSAREAAGRLRAEDVEITPGQRSVPAPPLREAEKVIAAFLGPPPFRELEIRDNAAEVPAEHGGQSVVTFVIAGRTGMRVKRPAYGAEGFVIDHYSPAVIDRFIQEIAEPVINACGPNPPDSLFCDSLEVGGEDWTDNFLEEFRKRRGYDLQPYLPALFTDIGPKTRDIRLDWGRTLTELFNEYFNKSFQRLAKKHNTRFRIQGYGTPPAALYSYAFADLGEGEGWQWKSFEESRWAASASHLLGRPVTSSETWTWLHSPVFMATPLDMKAEADLHFLQGINQLIGHGWPYTPPGVEYPGWRFYAAAVFNEKNPWWIVMPDVARYFQRVSYMMRAGSPANDVALYLPNSDAWASFTPGRVSLNAVVSQRLGPDIVRRILESGYNLDFFDDGLLEMRGKAEKNGLAFGDVRYAVVVLAGVERIPASTMRVLEEFVRGGGILIATGRLPALAPGFQATEEDGKAVREIARRLFEGPDARGIFLRDESEFGPALARRLPPDVALAPAEPEIGFVHRKTDGADIYFLANTANTARNVRATFRVHGMQPEWWDPMTGRVTAANVVERGRDGVTVQVALEPYGSRMLVFTRRRLPAAARTVTGPPLTLDLSRDWSVSFGSEGAPVRMETLRPWTQDPATRFFSGTATYEKRITVPRQMRTGGRRLLLDFGESKPVEGPVRGRFQALLEAPVREAAVVYVNGRRAGSVWAPPYRVDVTDFLRNGENRIRIEVANQAVNHMAGRPLPDYSTLNARYGERFQPQDMDQIRPLPSGLAGPIRLIATGQATR